MNHIKTIALSLPVAMLIIYIGYTENHRGIFLKTACSHVTPDLALPKFGKK
jgi:hypothetical protein